MEVGVVYLIIRDNKIVKSIQYYTLCVTLYKHMRNSVEVLVIVIIIIVVVVVVVVAANHPLFFTLSRMGGRRRHNSRRFCITQDDSSLSAC